MTVKGNYSFYAIDVRNVPGAIFYGYEPEFEEIEKVSDSFLDFLRRIMKGTIII